MEAVQHELKTEESELDEERLKVIHEVLHTSLALDEERTRVAVTLPIETRSVSRLLHIPLARWLARWLDDDSFADDLGTGFQLTGPMTTTDYQSAPVSKVLAPPLPAATARERRAESNRQVLSKLKESPFSDKIHLQMQEEALHGRMEKPRVMTQQDVENFNLARRIAVEEFREYEEGGKR